MSVQCNEKYVVSMVKGFPESSNDVCMSCAYYVPFVFSESGKRRPLGDTFRNIVGDFYWLSFCAKPNEFYVTQIDGVFSVGVAL